MIASEKPTGSSGRRALMAARAATCPAAIPSSRASISSGSATFANRYAGTPAASLAAASVARSSSLMKSGSGNQVSRWARFGSLRVTAYAIRSPNRSTTLSQ